MYMSSILSYTEITIINYQSHKSAVIIVWFELPATALNNIMNNNEIILSITMLYFIWKSSRALKTTESWPMLASVLLHIV